MPLNYCHIKIILLGFLDGSVGRESVYNAGDPSSIPGSGRSARERISYPFQFSWASLVAQLVKNLPAMQVRFLGWENPLENGKAIITSLVCKVDKMYVTHANGFHGM